MVSDTSTHNQTALHMHIQSAPLITKSLSEFHDITNPCPCPCLNPYTIDP